MQQPIEITGPESFDKAFNVSRETLEGLVVYAELLQKWQKAVNLVAPSTLDQLWLRHIGDSAQIVDILNKSDSSKNGGIWLDMGSGGGFPGLVAAIMLRENFDYRFHLVESTGRKCAFLSDVVRHLGLPVEIHNERVENLVGHSSLEQVSIISARALASLDQLLTMSEPFMSSDTVAYFFKGRDIASELVQAEEQWVFDSGQYVSRSSSDGCILEITNPVRKASKVSGG